MKIDTIELKEVLKEFYEKIPNAKIIDIHVIKNRNRFKQIIQIEYDVIEKIRFKSDLMYGNKFDFPYYPKLKKT